MGISGGLLMAAGLFLPWLTMGKRVGNGFEKLSYFAFIIFIFAVLIIVLAAFGLFIRKSMPVAALILDLIAFGATFLCFLKLREFIFKTAFFRGAPRFGFGFWLTMFGSLVAITGTLVLFLRLQKTAPTQKTE